MSEFAADAKAVLAEVMGMYGREMTGLEVGLWKSMIASFGDSAVINFLIRHSETSVFAPKPSEANKALRPGRDNAGAAFEELLRAVAQQGPYVNPTFTDPAIAGAVLLLGGWAKVNQEFPDPAVARFDFDAYSKRFDTLYQQSCANLMLGTAPTAPLLGLHALHSIELQKKAQLQLTLLEDCSGSSATARPHEAPP